MIYIYINCINSTNWIGIEQNIWLLKQHNHLANHGLKETPPPTSHNKIDFREILRKALTRIVVWEKKCLSWRRKFGKKSSFGTWNTQLAPERLQDEISAVSAEALMVLRTNSGMKDLHIRYLGNFVFPQRCFMCLQFLFSDFEAFQR